jgi:hypothetical protein
MEKDIEFEREIAEKLESEEMTYDQVTREEAVALDEASEGSSAETLADTEEELE